MRFKRQKGAERRVRELEKQIAEWMAIANAFDLDRNLLARLAAEGPAFDSPIQIAEAKVIRNCLLRRMGMNPDGTFIKVQNA